jgi:hypothetical protein
VPEWPRGDLREADPPATAARVCARLGQRLLTTWIDCGARATLLACNVMTTAAPSPMTAGGTLRLAARRTRPLRRRVRGGEVMSATVATVPDQSGVPCGQHPDRSPEFQANRGTSTEDPTGACHSAHGPLASGVSLTRPGVIGQLLGAFVVSAWLGHPRRPHGLDQTLGGWVLGVMCTVSGRSPHLQACITAREPRAAAPSSDHAPATALCGFLVHSPAAGVQSVTS